MLTTENIHENTRSSILAAWTRVYFPRVILFYAYDAILILTYAEEIPRPDVHDVHFNSSLLPLSCVISHSFSVSMTYAPLNDTLVQGLVILAATAASERHASIQKHSIVCMNMTVLYFVYVCIHTHKHSKTYTHAQTRKRWSYISIQIHKCTPI